MKIFKEFIQEKKDYKTYNITGYPSGEVIELDIDILGELIEKKLITYVDKYVDDYGEIIEPNTYMFEDKNIKKIRFMIDYMNRESFSKSFDGGWNW